LAPGTSQSTIKSPLALEVISGGGRRQLVGTRDDSIYLNSDDRTVAATDMADAKAGYGIGVIQAAERTRISSGVIELPALPPASVDPLLAKQQTIEGSVVLLAHIDKNGNIQNVHAISGPEILFGAAREAVKQWHFNPYYESGQAVETDTQITVKFDISAH
jgi:TonB family protein